MTIQGDKVYFEIKPQEKKKRTKGWLMQMEQKESFICKNLSVSTQYRSVKLIKDYKTNTYTEKRTISYRLKNYQQ
jgi:hypothetical protein